MLLPIRQQFLSGREIFNEKKSPASFGPDDGRAGGSLDTFPSFASRLT